MKKIRIGAITFLNVKPVFFGIEINNGESKVELCYSEPWQVTDSLRQRQVDLGILPSIEYTKLEKLSIVPGLSISSKGKVGSVKLFSRKPLAGIKRIALDSRSRTSVALLKILCKEMYKIEPEFSKEKPELDSMLKNADAALLIGDDALYARTEDLEVRDLSEDWYELTGYPFVFAVFAGWPETVDAEHLALLHNSLRQGLNNVHKISENHPGPGRGSMVEVNEKYLTENISYDFGEHELNGLKLFYIKAWENGLIDGVPRLSFFEKTH